MHGWMDGWMDGFGLKSMEIARPWPCEASLPAPGSRWEALGDASTSEARGCRSGRSGEGLSGPKRTTCLPCRLFLGFLAKLRREFGHVDPKSIKKKRED